MSTTNSTPRSSDAGEPVRARAMFRIVAGRPTPEELAALVVVLSARRGPDDPASPSVHSPWSDPARRLVGSSGWRGSALPR